MTIRTVHVVPRIEHEASGPSYSVVQLCKSLCTEKITTTLAVLDPVGESHIPNFVKSFPVSGFLPRLGFSKAMLNWLIEETDARNLDIIHNHSLWMMPNIYPGIASRRSKTPLIVSPRGTLSDWALNRSKLIKQIFWHTKQFRAISHATCFHATGENEYNDIRRAGFQQPVCIIPNGIDLPILTPSINPAGSLRKLMFLGRIHPVKGIDMLLHAWSVVSAKYEDWELHIVGPDSIGYLNQLKKLSHQLKLKRIVFSAPLYGRKKIYAYQQADLYVLPTHSENFGMTVAEALAAKTPVIVTQGAPWAGLEEHRAGWWIEIGVEPLIACLEEALSFSKERLTEMGSAGKKWMQNDYSWNMVGDKMYKTYHWILNGGSKPSWIKD